MEKGDICKRIDGKMYIDGNRNYFHYFVYWESAGDEFVGIMLTSTTNYFSDNVCLDDRHIIATNRFQYKNTQFVNQLLLKGIPIKELEVVARLSEKGICFINDNLSSLPSMTWNEFLNK